MRIVKKMEPWVFGGVAPPWRDTQRELELQKEEVREGNQIREIREQTIKRKEKRLEELEEYGKKMDERRKEECKRGERGIMGKSF